MSKDVEILLQEHQNLLEIKDTSNDEKIFEDILAFLDRIAKLGMYVKDPFERSQLRSLIRFWSGLIYDYSGDYVDVNLLPFSGEIIPQNSKPKNFIKPSRHLLECPNIEEFVGREQELSILGECLINTDYKIISIYGMGGIGKSSLATKLINNHLDEFEFIYWYSFLNAPKMNRFLADLTSFFSKGSDELFRDMGESIEFVIQCCKDHRCLIVIDNIETILDTNGFAGEFESEYKEYEDFFKIFAELFHNSCLIITSRERLNVLSLLETKTFTTKSFMLSGLADFETQELLAKNKLQGDKSTWNQLTKMLNGNPLALKIANEMITTYFDSDIQRFLKHQITAIGGIRDLLSAQIDRLSKLEKIIAYWLTINRIPVTLEVLLSDIVFAKDVNDIVEALDSLRKRSLIMETNGAFTLHPIVMEFLANNFVSIICNEILSSNIVYLKSHAIIKSTSKETIRILQTRMLLDPITHYLQHELGSELIEKKIIEILNNQTRSLYPEPSYVAGNIINMLCHLNIDISGYDFSHLSVHQAYLSGVNAHDIDFSYSDLSRSVFSETLGSVLALDISTDGMLMAIGNTTGDIHLWDLDLGKKIALLKGHSDWVRSIKFSPDNSLLVSCCDDQTIRVWDVNLNRNIRVLEKHVGRVWAAAFSPDNNYIASGGDDSSIIVWDVLTGKIVADLNQHSEPIWTLAFDPSGEKIISAGGDNFIGIWNWFKGEVSHIVISNDNSIRSLGISPDGSIIIGGGDTPIINIWDLKTGVLIGELLGHVGKVLSIDFSADGRFLASGGEDKTIKIWDLETLECKMIMKGHTNQILCVKFNQMNQIIASASDDTSLRLWDYTTGQCIQTLHGYNNHLVALSFNNDSTLLACGGNDHLIRLWNVSSGDCIDELYGHENRIWDVEFSPDGNLLASSSEDKTTRIWHVDSKKCIRILEGHTDNVWPISFNMDGSILASGSNDQTIRLWDLQNGKQINVLEDHIGPIWSIDFSPTGKLLATAGDDKTIRIWDCDSLECIKVIEGHSNLVWSIKFNSIGTRLVSASADKTINVWDPFTGELLGSLYGHKDQVTSISISPDDQTLVSCGTDRNIILWDLKTGTKKTVLKEHNSPLWSVKFSRDGKYFASCGDDETIRLWDAHNFVCLRIMKADKPYERMNITGIIGLTDNQKNTLKLLGATDIYSTQS